MTREETQKLLFMLDSTYPSYKVENKSVAVDIWHMTLEEYSFKDITIALKVYLKTDTSGFAPSPGKLIQCIPKKDNIPSELDAWAQTRLAIRDSSYHAEERFAELPEICQRIVESPDNLRRWAQMDSDALESVVMSQFLRSHRLVKERMRQEQSAPGYFPKIERHETPMIEDKVDVEQEMQRGIPMPDGMMEDVVQKLNYRR